MNIVRDDHAVINGNILIFRSALVILLCWRLFISLVPVDKTHIAAELAAQSESGRA